MDCNGDKGIDSNQGAAEPGRNKPERGGKSSQPESKRVEPEVARGNQADPVGSRSTLRDGVGKDEVAIYDVWMMEEGASAKG